LKSKKENNEININELIPDRKNANKHTEKGSRLLEKSLKNLGAGRSILIDKDNNIVAGNSTVEQATKLGLPVRIIETNGKELIAVKRTDVLLDSKKGRELAIADNQTAQEGIDFDFDVLEELNTEFDFDFGSEWEFDSPEIDSEVVDEKYSRSIKAPIYEPKNEKPEINEIFDEKKTTDLIKEIKDSNIEKNEKEFLIKAAQRHRVFNYSKIADYYSHSDKEMQNLMEKSALVIIDFNKAIENGFVKLTQEIADLYGNEYDEK
jgi:hypothetical protein